MIIKKFVGKTEEDATLAAKTELGAGIVIMNVRPVRKAGFWSFLRRPKTEVTVALEEEPDIDDKIIRPEKDPIIMRDEFKLRENADEEDRIEKAREKVDTGRKLAKAAQDGTLPPLKVNKKQPDIPVPEPPMSGLAALAAAAAQGKAQKAETDPAPMPSPIKVESPSVKVITPDKSAAIEEKLDSLQSLLEKKEDSVTLKAKQDTIPEETLSFIKLLYNTMLENEVDEHYANELTDEIEKFAKPGLPLEYALSNVYQKMILRFGKPEQIEPSENGVKAEIFIGPTGVGKTTTIAKLASHLTVSMHKKVALVTVDTYRIAAAEQLKTYASILEIPFRVIYSEDDMEKAAKDFSDMDYIMVDTAGHSIHNDEQKRDAAKYVKIMQEHMDTDIFLVMSASTKYRDLLEIADTYKKEFSYRLIFTKMDETSAVGNLYNIKLHTGAPMSYITNGQNVPDDIAVFDAQKVVKSLLGGKDDKK